MIEIQVSMIFPRTVKKWLPTSFIFRRPCYQRELRTAEVTSGCLNLLSWPNISSRALGALKRSVLVTQSQSPRELSLVLRLDRLGRMEDAAAGTVRKKGDCWLPAAQRVSKVWIKGRGKWLAACGGSREAVPTAWNSPSLHCDLSAEELMFYLRVVYLNIQADLWRERKHFRVLTCGPLSTLRYWQMKRIGCFTLKMSRG